MPLCRGIPIRSLGHLAELNGDLGVAVAAQKDNPINYGL